ncbi:hypothetical protein Pelo_1279 [Pelomyxa schiedti]|nr:hypothetical protein Pelo_1279 [Pelomyxa schiedti]
MGGTKSSSHSIARPVVHTQQPTTEAQPKPKSESLHEVAIAQGVALLMTHHARCGARARWVLPHDLMRSIVMLLMPFAVFNPETVRDECLLLSNGNTTLTKNELSNYWRKCVMGTRRIPPPFPGRSFTWGMRKDSECDWVFIGVAEECSLCIHAYGADSHAWGVAFSEEEGVHKAHNQRGELLTHKNIEQGDVVWITARYNESRTLSVSFRVNNEPELCCWSDPAMQNLTLFPSITLGPPATFTII